MINEHKKTIRITDETVWNEFTDSLIISAVFLGAVTIAANFFEIPLYGYPSGTFIVAAFSVLCVLGRTGAIADEPSVTKKPMDMLGYVILGTLPGFMLGAFGTMLPIEITSRFLGTLFLPIVVTYPLIKRKDVSRMTGIREVYRPTLPHLMLWATELSSGSIVTACIIAMVCSALEAASGWVSGRISLETDIRMNRRVRLMYPAFLALAAAALMCMGGTSIRVCVMVLVGVGLGLGAGKLASNVTVIQIAVGVGVASFITFLGF